MVKRKAPSKRTKSKAKAKTKTRTGQASRARKARPYPASSFGDARALGEAIMQYAAGEKVRRLTLLQQMNKSPNSGPTKMMITNSGKYGITTGSYAADHLELTEQGRIVVDPTVSMAERQGAAFGLAIEGIAPFKLIYDHYKDKRLPEREVMKDVLKDSAIDVPDLDECVDTFTVNVKDLDLLRTIGGAETLVSIEQALDELGDTEQQKPLQNTLTTSQSKSSSTVVEPPDNWKKVCFYITPIGSDDSEERKHADLFISSLVQPALGELGLTVVRADQIGEPGIDHNSGP